MLVLPQNSVLFGASGELSKLQRSSNQNKISACEWKKNKPPERREENNKIGFNAANIVLHIYPYLPLKYGLNDYLTDLHSQRNLVK